MMKKDFQEKTMNWRWIGWIGICLFFICISGFVVYQYKKRPLPANGIITYFPHIQSWVAERKLRLHHDLIKIKEATVDKNQAEMPVHFEFYSTLPAMQVTTKRIAEKKEESSVKTHYAAKMPSATLPNPFIGSAEKLAKEFSTRMKKDDRKKFKLEASKNKLNIKSENRNDL